MKSRVHGRLWDLNPTSQYEEIRKLTLERGKESIRKCSLINGDVVTIHPGRCWVRKTNRPSKTCKNWFREYKEKLSKLADEYNIDISIETGTHEANYPSSIKDFLKETEDQENVGITIDIGHCFLSELGPENKKSEWIAKLIKKTQGKLKNVHIHDNDGHSDLHLPPKSGKINFEPIIKALKKHYNGPLILELWDPENPIETAKEGIDNLRDLLS